MTKRTRARSSRGDSAKPRSGSRSSSLSHKRNEAATAEAPDLPFHLTGSQRKTAYALELNIARMVREAGEARLGVGTWDESAILASGMERCGFLTLTVGDQVGDEFRQVWDAKEASRRIHSLMTGLLSALFPRAVIVTERHKSGAIHFHLVVECQGDIRGAFDFDAFLAARNARKEGRVDHRAEARYESTATPALRALWAILRERLPGYGFGRAELTPIYKTGEAISRYVAKYVEKNLFARRDEDKRKKLVRYMGWRKRQLRPNDFAWATPRAIAWRNKARQLCALVGVREKEEARKDLGPRWAFKVTRVMHAVDNSPTPAGMLWVTSPSGFSLDYRNAARSLMAQECDRWLDKLVSEAWRDTWEEIHFREIWLGGEKPHREPEQVQRLFSLS